MFTIFESADGKERERVTQRRLEIMRDARIAGYYAEEGSERIPEIVADGRGPDDARPADSYFAAAQAAAGRVCDVCGDWGNCSVCGDIDNTCSHPNTYRSVAGYNVCLSCHTRIRGV